VSLFWICVIIGLVPFVLYFRWFIIQLLIVIAVIFSNIAYGWAGDTPSSPWVAVWCGIFAAVLFTAATNKVVLLWRRLAGRHPEPWETHQMTPEAAADQPTESKETLAYIQELLRAENDSKYPVATRARRSY
jgi:hypothetical protein